MTDYLFLIFIFLSAGVMMLFLVGLEQLEMAQLYRRGTPNHLNPAYAAKVIELNEEWARQLRMKKAKAEETLADAAAKS